jgi:hypothetical protein
MRLPRVRFTVRGLMLAVAVVAIPLTIMYQLRERRRRFGVIASAEARRAEMWLQRGGGYFDNRGDAYVSLPEAAKERLQRSRGPAKYRALKLALHHWELESKYRGAALRPWLPVPPDPPEPE